MNGLKVSCAGGDKYCAVLTISTTTSTLASTVNTVCACYKMARTRIPHLSLPHKSARHLSAHRHRRIPHQPDPPSHVRLEPEHHTLSRQNSCQARRGPIPPAREWVYGPPPNRFHPNKHLPSNCRSNAVAMLFSSLRSVTTR